MEIRSVLPYVTAATCVIYMEPVIVHQQPNEVAIFTVTNKQVHHADLTTQSSSKMGNKTRQTYLE